jgi:hypothetical protein
VPVDTEDKALGWSTGTLEAFHEIRYAEQKAARWTAASVLLASISAVLGNIN